MRVPLSQPDLGGREIEYAKEALDSGWISSTGAYVEKAEKAWANYCGVKHSIVTCNGTASLHAALMALGLKAGDEVIVPGLTFVSPAAVVARMSGVPVFADVEDVSWCMDPDDVERLITPKTKGVIAVDVLGHPADYDRLAEICAKHKLFMIEDAAEAHGSKYKGKRTGSFGDVASFSFFANKTLGCGEGGALTTNSDELAKRMALAKNHGMTKERPYWHESLGDNFRMTNVTAALLLGQIERADELTLKRNEVSKIYREVLSDVSTVQLRPSAEWADVVTWIECLRVLPGAPLDRAALVAKLREAGIDARSLWTPLVDLPPYQADCQKRGTPTPKSKELLSQTLWLPTASNMPREDVYFVAETVRSLMLR